MCHFWHFLPGLFPRPFIKCSLFRQNHCWKFLFFKFLFIINPTFCLKLWNILLWTHPDSSGMVIILSWWQTFYLSSRWKKDMEQAVQDGQILKKLFSFKKSNTDIFQVGKWTYGGRSIMNRTVKVNNEWLFIIFQKWQTRDMQWNY